MSNKGKMTYDKDGKELGFEVPSDAPVTDAPSASDKGSITKLNNRIKGLEAQVDELVETNLELTGRIEGLEAKVDTLADISDERSQAEALDTDAPEDTEDGSGAGN